MNKVSASTGLVAPHPLPILVLLSALTLLVHGYHPFAEDGGIYVTGVKLFLRPSLYLHDMSFVTARRAYSLFDPIFGTLVRWSHLSLEVVLLAAQMACIFLTLLAVYRLAALCFCSPHAPLYAAALATAAFTLPVAGTSLFFMEPYITARSFSTPLSLLAISFFLDPGDRPRNRANVASGVALLLSAALFHLAMAAYTIGFLVLLITARIRERRLRLAVTIALLAAVVLVCLAVQLRAPHEPAVALAAARTRTYWYLSQWQWFEWLGLVCPLVAFTLARRYARSQLTPQGRTLLETATIVGGTACLLSFCFVHFNQDRMALARLQPLRAFHNLYGILIVLLGGLLASWGANIKRVRWLPIMPVVCIAIAFFLAQRATFPASDHIELPGRPAQNRYTQAFVWARLNTPQDALFALDAHYITRNGDDSQNFRAIAERSMLSDYSKDGGVAAIRPALAPAWLSGSTASSHLSEVTAPDRTARLKPLGVTWVVLRSSIPTARPCPYDNGTVMVCPLD